MPFSKYAHIIPFFALMTSRPPELPNRPMVTRLIEQGVVGLVAAFIAIYVNDIRQEEQLKFMREGIINARVEVREMESRIMSELGREHNDRMIYEAKDGRKAIN